MNAVRTAVVGAAGRVFGSCCACPARRAAAPPRRHLQAEPAEDVHETLHVMSPLQRYRALAATRRGYESARPAAAPPRRRPQAESLETIHETLQSIMSPLQYYMFIYLRTEAPRILDFPEELELSADVNSFVQGMDIIRTEKLSSWVLPIANFYCNESQRLLSDGDVNKTKKGILTFYRAKCLCAYCEIKESRRIVQHRATVLDYLFDLRKSGELDQVFNEELNRLKTMLGESVGPVSRAEYYSMGRAAIERWAASLPAAPMPQSPPPSPPVSGVSAGRETSV